MMRNIWRKADDSPFLAYVLAIVLATLYFFSSYPDPVAFLSGDSVFFEVGDAVQHVSGWLLYAKDAWRWPLLRTELLAPPEGTHIALTDSIPLAALVFKPLFPIIGQNFHYFGLWHLLAALLQAFAAVFLLRSLEQKSLIVLLCGAALALLTPAMLDRVGHTALMTHGLILLALGLYFRATALSWTMGRISLLFALLSLASLLVHPYLFAMVFPIYLACAWDRWMPERNWRAALQSVVLTSLCVALPALMLGYAGASSNQVTDIGAGHGHFSMNLLAPFCGGAIGLCEYQDATGGQYEGYNRLGLGAMLVLVAGGLTWVWSKRASAGRRSRWGIGIILAGFTLYALTTQIYVGADLLLNLPQPPLVDRVTEIFRATGRFFWPVGYALVFGAIALLAKKPRLAMLILPLAVAGQWLDTAQDRADNIAALTSPRPFDYSGWQDLAGDIQAIEINPPFGCDPSDDTMRYAYFQLVAGRLGVPINTGYLARSKIECSTPQIGNDLWPNTTLSVFTTPDALPSPLPDTWQRSLETGQCVVWKAWGKKILCLEGATRVDWERLGIL